VEIEAQEPVIIDFQNEHKRKLVVVWEILFCLRIVEIHIHFTNKLLSISRQEIVHTTIEDIASLLWVVSTKQVDDIGSEPFSCLWATLTNTRRCFSVSDSGEEVFLDFCIGFSHIGSFLRDLILVWSLCLPF